jgi:hypothetical protein
MRIISTNAGQSRGRSGQHELGHDRQVVARDQGFAGPVQFVMSQLEMLVEVKVVKMKKRQNARIA